MRLVIHSWRDRWVLPIRSSHMRTVLGGGIWAEISWTGNLVRLSNKPLQTIPPQRHRIESRGRLGGGLAAERQTVRRTYLGEMTSTVGKYVRYRRGSLVRMRKPETAACAPM